MLPGSSCGTRLNMLASSSRRTHPRTRACQHARSFPRLLPPHPHAPTYALSTASVAHPARPHPRQCVRLSGSSPRASLRDQRSVRRRDAATRSTSSSRTRPVHALSYAAEAEAAAAAIAGRGGTGAVRRFPAISSCGAKTEKPLQKAVEVGREGAEQDEGKGEKEGEGGRSRDAEGGREGGGRESGKRIGVARTAA